MIEMHFAKGPGYNKQASAAAAGCTGLKPLCRAHSMSNKYFRALSVHSYLSYVLLECAMARIETEYRSERFWKKKHFSCLLADASQNHICHCMTVSTKSDFSVRRFL